MLLEKRKPLKLGTLRDSEKKKGNRIRINGVVRCVFLFPPSRNLVGEHKICEEKSKGRKPFLDRYLKTSENTFMECIV